MPPVAVASLDVEPARSPDRLPSLANSDGARRIQGNAQARAAVGLHAGPRPPASSRHLRPSAVRRSTSDGSVSGTRLSTGQAGPDELSLPLGALKDENRALREELAKFTGTAVSPIIPVRRPMAAIAGGGFRGQASSTAVVHKRCECDALRAKLSRIRSELAELREGRGVSAQSSGGQSFSVRTDASPSASSSKPTPPATPPYIMTDLAGSLSYPDVVCHEVGVQAEQPPDSSEEAVQCEACTQTSLDCCDAATSAAPEVSDSEVQTDACRILDPCLASEVGVQAEPLMVSVAHMPVQTDLEPVSAPVVQAVDADIQASFALECMDSFTQTQPLPACASTSVQTSPLHTQTVAVQASFRPDVRNASTMAVDDAAVAREREWALRLQKMEEFTNALKGNIISLQDELEASNETVVVLKHAMHSKALGHMNVTILCPRAECTVGGDHICIDGWDPDLLKKEFERDVLPRFTRVFVEESSSPAGQGTERRTEVMDQAMEEFATIFRERLSKMLDSCAPEPMLPQNGPRVPLAQFTTSQRTRR